MSKIKPLPRSAPEAQGVSSPALLEFIDTLDKTITEMHGLVLLRHGQVVAEGWWRPYRADLPHMLFSLTKSFTSTAVGMAVAEGLLSVDDRVVSFFPDKLPKRVSKNLAAMRVHHLLSMSTGQKKEPSLQDLKPADRNDWIKGFLAAPVGHKPGKPFVYNSAASHMLSAVVQRVTGQPLLDYLTPRLFEPLGIQPAHWDQDPQGIYTGGWGLMIRTEEIARFGQMYLQKGVWEGKQILPESWVAEATRKQVDNGSDPNNDWNQGYGYQFWRCRHDNYRGDGAFGQYCFVLPAWDAVLAINSAVSDMQAVMNVVWENLLPALTPAVLPADPTAEQALRSRLAGLQLPDPVDTDVSPQAEEFSGTTYELEANDFHFKTARFDFSVAQCQFTIGSNDHEHMADFAYRGWEFGQSSLFAPYTNPVTAHAAWLKPDTLRLTLRQITTPFMYNLDVVFSGDTITLEGAANVSFGPPHFPLLKGKAVKPARD